MRLMIDMFTVWLITTGFLPLGSIKSDDVSQVLSDPLSNEQK